LLERCVLGRKKGAFATAKLMSAQTPRQLNLLAHEVRSIAGQIRDLGAKQAKQIMTRLALTYDHLATFASRSN
jgi:hypothetical protein